MDYANQEEKQQFVQEIYRESPPSQAAEFFQDKQKQNNLNKCLLCGMQNPSLQSKLTSIDQILVDGKNINPVSQYYEKSDTAKKVEQLEEQQRHLLESIELSANEILTEILLIFQQTKQQVIASLPLDLNISIFKNKEQSCQWDCNQYSDIKKIFQKKAKQDFIRKNHKDFQNQIFQDRQYIKKEITNLFIKNLTPWFPSGSSKYKMNYAQNITQKNKPFNMIIQQVTIKTESVDIGEYSGQLQGDQRHGFGIHRYPDGTQYSGQWKNNKRNGQGTQTFRNGSKYSGQWKENQMNGRGISENYFMNGKYIGQFMNNTQHGKGTIICHNGYQETENWFFGKSESEIEEESHRKQKELCCFNDNRDQMDILYISGIMFLDSHEESSCIYHVQDSHRLLANPHVNIIME